MYVYWCAYPSRFFVTVYGRVLLIHCHLLPSPDPTLTEENVTAVMRVVRDWRRVGGLDLSAGVVLGLNIPDARLDVIEQTFSSTEEKATALGHYWMNTSLVASWQRLARALYHCGKERAVEAVRKHLPEKGMQMEGLAKTDMSECYIQYTISADVLEGISV